MNYNVIVKEKDNEAGTQKTKHYLVNVVLASSNKKNELDDNPALQTYIDNCDINTNSDLCYEIAKTEYEHCVQRSEKLDNKVYILLTVCAFIFAMLTGAIDQIGITHVGCKNTILILAFYIVLVLNILSFLMLIISLIYLLSGVKILRFDSSEILSKNMVTADRNQVIRYVCIKYEKARMHNNDLLEKRYQKLNASIRRLIVSVVLLLLVSILGALVKNSDKIGSVSQTTDVINEKRSADKKRPPYHRPINKKGDNLNGKSKKTK